MVSGEADFYGSDPPPHTTCHYDTMTSPCVRSSADASCFDRGRRRKDISIGSCLCGCFNLTDPGVCSRRSRGSTSTGLAALVSCDAARGQNRQGLTDSSNYSALSQGSVMSYLVRFSGIFNIWGFGRRHVPFVASMSLTNIFLTSLGVKGLRFRFLTPWKRRDASIRANSRAEKSDA